MSANRELKHRIGGVRSAQKVTRVMKLISGGHLAKARIALHDSDAALTLITAMRDRILTNINEVDRNVLLQEQFVRTTRNTKSRLIVMITGDRGLCGAYNNSMIRTVGNVLNEANPDSVRVLCIGNKGYIGMRNRFAKHTVERLTPDGCRIHSAQFSRVLTDKISALYLSHGVDAVEIYYTKFISALHVAPQCIDLLPIRINTIVKHTSPGKDTIYDLPYKEILSSILIQCLQATVYNILVSAYASEENSRVLAMDSATRNTDTMINDLQKKLNRNRQAAITSTLIDIINSSESI